MMQPHGGIAAGTRMALPMLLLLFLAALVCLAVPSHADSLGSMAAAVAETDADGDASPSFDAQQSALLAMYERTAAHRDAIHAANARAIEAAVEEMINTPAMMEIEADKKPAAKKKKAAAPAKKNKIASKKGGKKAAAAPAAKKGAAPSKSTSGQCASAQLAVIQKLKTQIAAAEAEAKKLGCVRGKDHPTKREQCRQIWCRIDALLKMIERAKKAVDMCKQIEQVRDIKVRDAKKRVKCVADEPKRRKDEKDRKIREEKERKERERKRKEEEERKRKELARQKAIAAAKRKEAARLAELARQKRLREEAEARRNKEAARVRRLNAEYASPKAMEVSVHRHKGAAPKPGHEGHGGKGDVTVMQADVKAPDHKRKHKKRKHADAKASKGTSVSFLEQQAQVLLSLSSRSQTYVEQRAAPKSKAKGKSKPKSSKKDPKDGKGGKSGKDGKEFCSFVFKMSDKEQAAEMARSKKLLAAIEAELKKLMAALKAHLSLKPLPLTCPKKVHLPFTFSSATASGDPHVDTFDGAHHDVMVAGWFTWVENSVLTVQGYSQLGCMPPNTPNTCLRAIVVRIRPPGTEEQLLVSWGQWPHEKKMQNIIIQDSTGKNVNLPPNKYKAATYLGKYSIGMHGGNLRISPVGAAIGDPELAVSVTIGTHFLAVTLPNAAPHRGATNGLMGFFVGHKNRADVQNIFRLRGSNKPNPAMKPNSIHGQTPEIRDWAASHVLTGPKGKNPPIPLTEGTGLKQQKYLNAHAQHIKHAGFLELAAGSSSELAVGSTAVSLALAEAAAEFSPVPRASKPLVLPSVTPPVTPEKMAFCKKLLAAGQKASKSKNKEVFAAQLKSCLQDAEAPSVARTVATAITVARSQQRAATKALKKKVVKDDAKCANTGKCAPPTSRAEIIYNADSPLSADDLRRLRQTHQDLSLPHYAKLVAQDTLDLASLTLDDAQAAKKALLDQYPTVE